MLKPLTALAFLLVLLIASPALAQGKGEGGCVISQKAPIYAKSDKKKSGGDATVGDCMVGVTTRGILDDEYQFEEEHGRLHIVYLAGKDESGIPHYAWISPADVSRFTYDCGCGTTPEMRANCSPFSGMASFVYNTCYKEARSKKLAELAKGGAPAPTTDQNDKSNAAKRSEKPLHNEDILSLVKVGLDEALIISKIKSAETTEFDLSTDGIVVLRTAKVSNAVIEAMLKRSTK